MRTRRSTGRWLAAVVVLHLLISFAHGMAHDGAQVPMSLAANLFIYIVILAGPLVGLGLMWPAPTLGNAIVGVTMAASLVFGIVNHFVLASPDHVSRVDAQWRVLFASTAVLLAVTEATACALAIAFARNERSL
jgi:hypothetical protein